MNTKEIEKKWQTYWEENKTFKTNLWDFKKPKFYALDMFPYPSGVGLHAGHPEGYTATDIVSRMKRMQGYNVLHPMGFDSFGLPAEQYAIKTGNHPEEFTKKNIITFTKQLKMLGFSYDFESLISTSNPSYYKWTQWIFKQLYLDGLVKNVDMPVNWCEELGTVLANDEVINGKSERGDYPVIRKNMKQWVIDMPKYAEKLLEGLNDVDYPLSTKEIQKNWIGKSVGAQINFKINNSNLSFEVFTTRPDTLFGVTYCVLAPEHILIDKITNIKQKEAINDYIKVCSKKSEIERTELNKEKTGVFTGSYAVNPINNKLIPIWISDYVLVTYGTGAIMAVPAHDERDYEFAKKFSLSIIPVIENTNISKEANLKDCKHINSGFLDGLEKEAAIDKVIIWLEKNKIGYKKINYRLREWIFARQRYWGEPIPIIHYDNGTTGVIEDKDLPLILPSLCNYSPSKTGDSPLLKATDWVNVTYNGLKGKRETSTMPGSAGASWYFLRYIDPFNDEKLASKELLDHWMPVDLYVGGPEHAVGHLLYARMWNNYLYDKGILSVKEPFKKLVHQGMILGSNGIKMGKRFPEYVVNPVEVVNEYGADAMRLYEMFMGPLEMDKPWDNSGIKGAKKFLDRIWNLYHSNKIINENNFNLEKIYNQTIKKVTNDYESLNFNTAISQMMIFINAVYKENKFPIQYAENFIKILNPIAPYMTEEIWNTVFNYNETISYEKWPDYDENKIFDETFIMVVQVNGKVRGKMEVDSNLSDEEMEKIAVEIDNVKNFIDGKKILKIITISKKMVNIVIKL